MSDTGPGAGRLVAVVVTHNRLGHLRRTLAALLDTPASVLAAVLVVDNGSTDGTADWLREIADTRLTIRESSRNLGGAGGLALGLRCAVDDLAPDWIVVMDDDARPEAGALALFHAADLDGWDAVAAAVRTPDGRICEMNRPTYNPFWHLGVFLRTALGGARDGFHLGQADFDSGRVRRVDGASFVGFFLSRRALTLGGYPDGSLFLYADDALYTLGLTAAGARIAFMPEIRFEHDCGNARAGVDGPLLPLWKVYYFHRNLLRLYRWVSGPLFGVVLIVVLPRWVMRARAYRGRRMQFLGLLSRAIRDGVLARAMPEHTEVRAWAGESAEGGTPHGQRQTAAGQARARGRIR